MRFEWDEAKNLSNQRKHAIGFEEATQVFRDPLYILIPDRVAEGEERWRAFGRVRGVLLLMVAHTIRESHDDGLAEEVIRIISARYATPKERRDYEIKNG